MMNKKGITSTVYILIVIIVVFFILLYITSKLLKAGLN